MTRGNLVFQNYLQEKFASRLTDMKTIKGIVIHSSLHKSVIYEVFEKDEYTVSQTKITPKTKTNIGGVFLILLQHRCFTIFLFLFFKQTINFLNGFGGQDFCFHNYNNSHKHQEIHADYHHLLPLKIHQCLWQSFTSHPTHPKQKSLSTPLHVFNLQIQTNALHFHDLFHLYIFT